MFVDKPPLTGKANTADEMKKASYNKLQPPKAGPFQIIKLQPLTVVLDEEGVLNTVSVQRITAALGLRGYRPKTAQTPGSPKYETHTMQQLETEKSSVSVSKTPTSVSEYAIDRIVRREDYGRNRKNIVTLDGYGPKDSTLEPAKNIPKHFIIRYYRRLTRRQATA